MGGEVNENAFAGREGWPDAIGSTSRISTSCAVCRRAISRRATKFDSRKKIFEGAGGLLGRVDDAALEAVEQRVRGQIDHDHLAGLLDDPVGHSSRTRTPVI